MPSKRIALELERERKATQCGVHATAIAELVRRPHQQTVEPLVPGRDEQPLQRRPVGEPAVAAIEGVLAETARDIDDGRLHRRL